MSARRRRVLILQPYVPQYRAPFFEALSQRLHREGVDVEIVVPDRPLAGTRSDATAAQPGWLAPRAVRRIRIAGRELHTLRGRLQLNPGDGVVVGLQGTLPDVYRLLLRPRRRYGVGLWGHVGAYVGPSHPVDVALEHWQMKRADHVFAYTPGGSETALGVVQDESKVTTVMNSVDLSYLDGPNIDAVASQMRQANDLSDETATVGYIGALDASKRLDFLAAALEHLWADAPHMKVLVGGAGPDADLLDRSLARGQVVLLGRVDGPTKAAMGRVCGAFLMPGRVGLVAVETLAMGRPLVTTRWPWHAPEIEYLTEGSSLVTTDDDPEAFAHAVRRAATSPRAAWPYPSLDEMAENFSAGVLAMLDTHR